jgi:ribonuclease HI
MMEGTNREYGTMQWATDHNSRFKVNKFALIDFTRSKTRQWLPLIIQNTTILPTEHHRFLGLIVDQELTWKHHVGYTIAKGTEYVLQLCRLSHPANGIPAKLMRRLYLTVAVPKFTYGADIWFRPIYNDNSVKLQRGSIGVAGKLAKIQRIAAICITGAMKTTATDILDAHANLLPIPLLLQKVCHRAALRIATLPQRHPLFTHVQHIVRFCNICTHRSSLHDLISTYQTFPDDVETLDPARQSNARHKNAYNTHIAQKKETAIKEQRELKDEIQIFTDGSGHNGGIGAAAVLMREGKEPCTLKYHLGSDKAHTVYEAEVVGLTLAVKLLATESNVTYPASIFVDNQAAIQSGESHNTKPGGYLVEHFRRSTRALAKRRREQEHNFDLTVRWIPGHKGVKGNELADEAAKEAATGENETSTKKRLPQYLQDEPLPNSVSALRQWHQAALSTRWSDEWKLSPRYARAKVIDHTMPSNKFLKLISPLPKCQTSIYTQLRTRHIPLNHHLHRIGRRDSPHCPICPGIDETIHHYLFDCPQYAREQHILSNALRCNASSISYLLSSDKATKPLMRFINSSGRLKPTFGEITID